MAQGTIALPQTQTFRPTSQLMQLVPGVLLLTSIGWLGKFIEQSVNFYAKSHHLHVPNIEYVLWAILIGLAVSNTIGIPALYFVSRTESTQEAPSDAQWGALAALWRSYIAGLKGKD